MRRVTRDSQAPPPAMHFQSAITTMRHQISAASMQSADSLAPSSRRTGTRREAYHLNRSIKESKK